MSNQPKITYRSDTTGFIYQMMQGNGSTFTIVANRIDETWGAISPIYACQFPWRLTINRFFDIVTNHINTGEWTP